LLLLPVSLANKSPSALSLENAAALQDVADKQQAQATAKEMMDGFMVMVMVTVMVKEALTLVEATEEEVVVEEVVVEEEAEEEPTWPLASTFPMSPDLPRTKNGELSSQEVRADNTFMKNVKGSALAQTKELQEKLPQQLPQNKQQHPPKSLLKKPP
jgi:hypothetical protein